ncbi:hypothetical protein GBL_3414 [Geobacillus kaustophilus GBlys]|uniref:Uncharacterized protein n=2 Tax=Geobacillus TaxID=129337 RepID=A0ABQ7HI44_GEOSE|nr:hypothetical protein GS8_836 [Geobacillus stearothermophilus]GAD15197.1 hypothetical protein GBL_3414 [Geobacillus kaustophilus GBlys]
MREGKTVSNQADFVYDRGGDAVMFEMTKSSFGCPFPSHRPLLVFHV